MQNTLSEAIESEQAAGELGATLRNALLPFGFWAVYVGRALSAHFATAGRPAGLAGAGARFDRVARALNPAHTP